MRLLLDTQIFIWFFKGSSKLSSPIRELLEAEGNEKLLSTASIWEMAIKQSTGKLSFSLPLKCLSCSGLVLMTLIYLTLKQATSLLLQHYRFIIVIRLTAF